MAASGNQTKCELCGRNCQCSGSNVGQTGGTAIGSVVMGGIAGDNHNIHISVNQKPSKEEGDDTDSLIEKQKEQFWYIEDSECYRKVKETLEKKHLVLITGAPEEGKTTLALQIYDSFRSKNYTGRYYMKSSSVSLENIWEENSVTLFDNLFAKPPGENIRQILKEIERQLLRRVQNSFIIIVCQLFDMKRAKAKLSSDLFKDDYVVNISDINCPEEDKINQWCERHSVLEAVAKYLSEDEKSQIAKYKPFMIGFPGMCAYYNTTAKISYSYLTFPQDFYSDQIKTLIRKDGEKKWLFTILILCGGEIDFSDTSNIQRKLDIVGQQFRKKSLPDLRKETEYLIDTYLVRIKPGVARFRYRVLHMACFLTIAQCIPEFISKHCKIEFLDDKKMDEEMCRKKDARKTEDDGSHGNLQGPEKICVPEECGTLMTEDVKRNVRLKRYCDSLKSPVLDYPVYRNSLLEMLENDEHNNYIRSNDNEMGGNFLYWSSDSGNENLTLEVLGIPKVSTRDVKFSTIACVEKDNVPALKILERSVKKCGRKNLKFDIDFKTESGKTPLMLASMYGHVKMVRHILELGGNMSTTDFKGQNCVHLAAVKDHVEVFQLLTDEDQGHVLNSKDINGCTPDIVALRKRGKVSEYLSSKYPTGVTRVKSLNERENLETEVETGCLGGDVNINTLRSACKKDKVREVQHILAKGKVRIDEKCTMAEETPVLIAANFGSKNVFDFLVSEGCDMTVVNDDGCNILHAACIGGNVDIVQYILNHNLVDVNDKDSQGRTPANIASQQGHVAVVELLRAGMTKTNRKGEQPLTDIQLETVSSIVFSIEKGRKGSHQQVPEECKGPRSGSGQETDVSKSQQRDSDKATDITLKSDGVPPRMHVISDIDVNGKEQGLRVLRTEKTPSIECDGRLQVNDRIIEINGTHLEGLCFDSAQKIFWNAMRGAEVRLKVIRYHGMSSFPKRNPPPIMPKPKVRPPVKPATLPPKGDNSPQSSSEKTSKQADVDMSLTNNQQKLRTQQLIAGGGPRSDSGDVSISHHKDRDKAIEIVMKKDDCPQEIQFIDDDGRELGLMVHKVGVGGTIVCDGKLQVNDRIIEINGIHLEGVCFHSAQNIFWEAIKKAEVRLKVIKNQGSQSLPKRKPTIMPKPTLEQKGSSDQLSKRQHETSNRRSPSLVHDETDQLQNISDHNQKPSEDQSVPGPIYIVGGSRPVSCPPMTLDSDRVNSDKCQVTENGELRNSSRPGERLSGGFRNYRGTCSRLPIPLPSSPSTVTTPRYWETHTRVRVVRQLSWLCPILEMGVSQEEKVDTEYWVSSHSHSWAVHVGVCIDHFPRICTCVWSEVRQFGDCGRDTFSNTSDTTAVLHYGVVLDVETGTVAFIDLDREIVLHKFHVKFTEPLRPMFGVGPSQFYTVEMRLVSGVDITMTDKKKDLISQALTTA